MLVLSIETTTSSAAAQSMNRVVVLDTLKVQMKSSRKEEPTASAAFMVIFLSSFILYICDFNMAAFLDFDSPRTTGAGVGRSMMNSGRRFVNKDFGPSGRFDGDCRVARLGTCPANVRLAGGCLVETGQEPCDQWFVVRVVDPGLYGAI